MSRSPSSFPPVETLSAYHDSRDPYHTSRPVGAGRDLDHGHDPRGGRDGARREPGAVAGDADRRTHPPAGHLAEIRPRADSRTAIVRAQPGPSACPNSRPIAAACTRSSSNATTTGSMACPRVVRREFAGGHAGERFALVRKWVAERPGAGRRHARASERGRGRRVIAIRAGVRVQDLAGTARRPEATPLRVEGS